MWLNGTSQYALRAVLYVGEHDAKGPVRVEDIAAALASPRNYLSKTLHALVQAGVLRSARGPGGGFQLAAAPSALPLARVVAPFEPVRARRCLIGRPDCGGAHPCLAHSRWERVASAVSDFFEHTTVADLLADRGGRAALAPAAAAAPHRKRAGSVRRSNRS